MEYGGSSFYRQREVVETGTTYFICARYRSGSRARLIVRDDVVKARNGHSCDEEEEEKKSSLTEVRSRMRTELQKAGLANLSLPPSMVWEQVTSSLQADHPTKTLRMIPRLPSIAVIKYARAQATGSDAFRAIETPPTRNVGGNNPRPFLQFNVVHKIGCGLHRCVGFGHPELIRLLRYSNAAIFIDGTFKMVPAPFKQCLIVMVKDLGVDVDVPAMYVLLDSKQQDAYWNALDFVVIQTGRLLEPGTVTCDFEKALMNAITEQFPLVKIVGCLFHWKQALRRKMVDLRIPQDQIVTALSPGTLDVLTIIPVAEVADKGIRFVRSRITETGTKNKWDTFWRYFRLTWMKNYGAELWNVNSMIETGVDVQNRTNNPLESYNRVFGEKFAVKHPSLLAFVEIAKEEARRFVRLIDDVKNHRRDPPPHAQHVEPVIPPEYNMLE